MTVERCKNCGATLDVTKAVGGVITCEFCHSVNILPKSVDAQALSFIKMGEHDLDTRKFADAYEAFNKAAQLDPKEPEAYFGMALATYKIQYIKDFEKNRLQPICYEVSDKKFTDDMNYMKAFMNATNEQRAEYIRKADDINKIRDEFYSIKSRGLEYDCFICVKVSDDNAILPDGTKARTKDYKIADDLYVYLRQKGFSPFFSEREIQNRTGADYEAMILYALCSSECMLVVCGDERYLETPWVKNEYTRFSAMVDDEQKESDAITIVFDGKPIERLPGRKGKIQGIDMRGIDPYGKVADFVFNHTPEARARREQAEKSKREEEERIKKLLAEQLEAQRALESKLESLRTQTTVVSPVQAPAADINLLLRRTQQFLDSGDYDGATDYCNRALDVDPENGEAWIMSFLAKYQAENFDELLKKCVSSRYIDTLLSDKSFVNMKKYASARVAELEQQLDKLHADLLVSENYGAFLAECEIDGSEFVKYNGSRKHVVIPDNITQIGESAFADNEELESVELNNVRVIDDDAFKGCYCLRNINVSNKVVSIGTFAFRDTWLESITLPFLGADADTPGALNASHMFGLSEDYINDGMNYKRKLGASAEDKEDRDLTTAYHAANGNVLGTLVSSAIGFFDGGYTQEMYKRDIAALDKRENRPEYCNKAVPQTLKTVTLTDLETIADRAFFNCKYIETINIPNTVKKIGNEVFANCSALKSINVAGDNPAYMSINGILYNKAGTQIIWCPKNSGGDLALPEDIAAIPNKIFINRLAIMSVTLGNKVTNIGESAFSGCLNLQRINVPASVKSIGREAFANCRSLTEIDLPVGMININDGTFAGCDKLKRAPIPAGVAKIGVNAFRGCAKLTDIVIPDSVEEIGDNAFDGCNGLSSITIPKKFKWGMGKIFGGCHKRANITFTK